MGRIPMEVDERDYAQEWFERCGYGMNSEKTFLRYILEEG